MEALKQLVTRICQSHKVSKKDDENIKGMVLKITSLTFEQTKILENLKSGYVKKDDIEQLTKLFDDVNKQIDVSDSVESEIVSTKINSCDVEDTLDKTVAKYSGFSEKHPMEYVNYDETHSNYRVRQTSHSFACKKSEVVCKKVLEKLIIKNTDNEMIRISPIINDKKYDGKLISYEYSGCEYFDIYHIFNALKLKQGSQLEKYNALKTNRDIKYYSVFQNQFGGYVIREYISKDCVTKLVCSSYKISALKLAKLLGICVYDKFLTTKEQKWLDIIEETFSNEKFIEQHHIKHYRVDLLFTKYKLIIECDEFNHDDRDPLYEYKRQKYLEKKGYTFVRFNPDDKNFSIYKVLGEIHNKMK